MNSPGRNFPPDGTRYLPMEADFLQLSLKVLPSEGPRCTPGPYSPFLRTKNPNPDPLPLPHVAVK